MRGLRDKRKTKNRSLTAFVENGVLTIEIGVDTLAFATLHCMDEDRSDHVITDSAGFADDVVHELLDEAEDGSSIITRLFDNATAQALDQGSPHCVPKDEP